MDNNNEAGKSYKQSRRKTAFNSSMDTSKPHSNGPLYSNTVIGTLAV